MASTHEKHAAQHVRSDLGVRRVFVPDGRTQVVLKAALQQRHERPRVLLDGTSLPVGDNTGEYSTGVRACTEKRTAVSCFALGYV